MDRVVLDHQLTAPEAEAFARDGYLIVERALEGARLAELRDAALAHDRDFRGRDGVGPYHVLNEHDLIVKDDVWLELVDQPTTFAKVWGIMGWNIQLFHTQLLVTPPAPAEARGGAYGWHQDNNRMNRDLDIALHPMVSLKVGYFVSDLPEPGMGNLCVVPGSHRLAKGEFGVGDDGQPDGAIEVCARAGDAIVFDRRLWHSASTNCSSTTRIFLTYGYSYRWLRPKSAMQHEHLYDQVDPIRRQLLGFCTTANGYYDPLPDDVPLREWIREHVGDDAVAP